MVKAQSIAKELRSIVDDIFRFEQIEVKVLQSIKAVIFKKLNEIALLIEESKPLFSRPNPQTLMAHIPAHISHTIKDLGGSN